MQEWFTWRAKAGLQWPSFPLKTTSARTSTKTLPARLKCEIQLRAKARKGFFHRRALKIIELNIGI